MISPVSSIIEFGQLLEQRDGGRQCLLFVFPSLVYQAVYPKPPADSIFTQYSVHDPESGNRFKILVSAVEQQLRYALSLRTPIRSRRGTRYPHDFKNFDELDLSIPGHEPWQEFPVFKDSKFEDGNKPGPVRVVYTRLGYDVVYHNPKKIKRGTQIDGAMKKVADFVKARRVSRNAGRRTPLCE